MEESKRRGEERHSVQHDQECISEVGQRKTDRLGDLIAGLESVVAAFSGGGRQHSDFGAMSPSLWAQARLGADGRFANLFSQRVARSRYPPQVPFKTAGSGSSAREACWSLPEGVNPLPLAIHTRSHDDGD